MKKASVAVLSGVLLISGCATAPTSSDQGNATESTASGAAIGALLGCGLAAAMGGSCAKGALLGGALGAAVGWNINSQKVASAQQVNAEARREGLTVPINEIRLKDYQLNPSSSVARVGGAPIQVVGDIKLYGQSVRRPELVQSMILVKPDGENANENPQIAKIQNVDGAGHYRAIGTYRIPNGMPQGRYEVRSALSLNGQEVSRKDTAFQVAYVDGRQVVMLASNQ